MAYFDENDKVLNQLKERFGETSLGPTITIDPVTGETILGAKKKARIDLDHIKEIIDRIGGFNYAKDKITDFNEQALDAISPYPNSPYKQSMIDLIAFNMQRTG